MLPSEKNNFDKSITKRERACFEAGIKLGAIFHSVLAFPVQNDEKLIKKIQEGFRASFLSQPFVEDIDIQINLKSDKFTKVHEFDYTTIKSEDISIKLKINYDGTEIIGELRWIDELGYPLMYVSKIQ